MGRGVDIGASVGTGVTTGTGTRVAIEGVCCTNPTIEATSSLAGSKASA